MYLFYAEMFIYWFFVLFIIFYLSKMEGGVVNKIKKQKFKFIIYILFCLYFMPDLVEVGIAKPFVTKKVLNELEISEGLCKVYTSSKFNRITLHCDDVEFDFSLEIPCTEKGYLNGKELKIWHKKGMVYQYTVNDKFIMFINDANNNIEKYNLLVAPLAYLVTAELLLYVFGLLF